MFQFAQFRRCICPNLDSIVWLSEKLMFPDKSDKLLAFLPQCFRSNPEEWLDPQKKHTQFVVESFLGAFDVGSIPGGTSKSWSLHRCSWSSCIATSFLNIVYHSSDTSSVHLAKLPLFYKKNHIRMKPYDSQKRTSENIAHVQWNHGRQPCSISRISTTWVAMISPEPSNNELCQVWSMSG